MKPHVSMPFLIHEGHLKIAQVALFRCSLDIPSGSKATELRRVCTEQVLIGPPSRRG